MKLNRQQLENAARNMKMHLDKLADNVETAFEEISNKLNKIMDSLDQENECQCNCHCHCHDEDKVEEAIEPEFDLEDKDEE
jgi:hypothetical protein